jgi:hypothetical protein
MFELSTSQKVNVYRAAGLCALIAVIFFLIGLVLAIFYSLPDMQASLSERLHFIARHEIVWKIQFLLIFLFFFLQIPVLYGFYGISHRHYPGIVLWGLVLGVIALIICLQNSFALVSAIPRMAKIYVTTNDELLKYAIVANFNGNGFIQLHSVSFSEMILGWSLLGGFHLLSGIALLKSLKLQRLIGLFLLFAGAFSILGFMGHVINYSYLEMAIPVQILFYLIGLGLAVPVFYQEAKLNLAISK